MNHRFFLLLVARFALVAAVYALSACGDDDGTPPPTDAGTTDAPVVLLDAARRDASECLDEDGDGYGASPCGDDCDDNDASRYPTNTEVCDGDDEDCNDATFGPDGDGDTFVSALCCNGPGRCGSDCNDALNTVNPGAAEQCNGGIDDDCDGLAEAASGECAACESGYRGLVPDCENIDECDEFAPCGVAADAICTDTPGSYTCSCPPGFAAPATGGTCSDINECAIGACGPGVATCRNSVGSYDCICFRGYSVAGPGAPCVDIDECAIGPACGVGLGTCANTDGGYACTCIAGYAQGPDGGPCVDIDECALGTDDCTDAPAGVCTNTDGGFACACSPSYIGGTGRGPGGCGTTRFTDLGDGTVRDARGAGLDWQQGFSPSTQGRADAFAYCAALALDGGGWRLPTIDELVSILDRRFIPTVDPVYFPGTPSEKFWSSSLDPIFPTLGRGVDLMVGGAGSVPFTTLGYARCVR